MSLVLRRVLLAFVLVAGGGLLSGCAYYATPAGTYSYIDSGRAVYVAPYGYYPPVYYDPWYVGPPVFFNFGFHSYHHQHPHSSYGGYYARPYGGHGGGHHYRHR